MLSAINKCQDVFLRRDVKRDEVDSLHDLSESSLGACVPCELNTALVSPAVLTPGWYWGGLTANEAKELLHDAPEGTFLVRDSSQRDYLFTISAMTSAGPTNLRIEYKEGKFKLDSVVLIRPKLRQFDSVVRLVEHYVRLSRTSSRASVAAASSRASTAAASSRAGGGVSNPQPGAGASPSGTVQLLLTMPVYTATPSLQHLCRVSINRSARRVPDLPLPPRLIDYLADYAYHV